MKDWNDLSYTTTITLAVRDVYHWEPTIPSGFKVCAFRIPNIGETYISATDEIITRVCKDWSPKAPRLILEKIPQPAPPPEEGSWAWAVSQMMAGRSVRNIDRPGESMWQHCLESGPGSVYYGFQTKPYGKSIYRGSPQDLKDGWEVCD